MRGSQLYYAYRNAWPVMRALIDRGVIGDFRAPDVLRFGFTPLYVGFAELWDAVATLKAFSPDGCGTGPNITPARR